MHPYFAYSLLIAVACWSCQQENPDTPTVVLPTTYSFDHVNYSGQTQRLAMLLELGEYMKSANAGGIILDETKLLAQYANQPGAGFRQTYEASKQLRDKTFPAEQTHIETLLRELTKASQAGANTSAAPGLAGIVTSTDGTKKYLLAANGLEYAQVIEKAIMGATLYYQATAVYLSEGKMNVDNTTITPGEGTMMQHHWDEAFGYLGVPIDFPANTNGLYFWGTYTNRRDPLLGVNQKLMNAFIKGRVAIGNKDYTTRDATISEVRNYWEQVVAATALNYLNTAIVQFDDLAVRTHAISEGVAFIYSLQFNPSKKITNDEVKQLLLLSGGGDTFLSMNLYNVTKANLETARQQLAAKYGWQTMMSQF
ncbi:MAG: DUF4856 domain-containing protein [Lewinellaceae bacterium]|nr:DUF4856 domain-containing protein [Lewinellaceae bacterium]